MKLLPKVATVDHLAYQNVVRRSFKAHYSEMESQMKDFISGIEEAGYHVKGPFFYSLNNVPLDEIVDIEMFLPIDEYTFQLEGYEFSTYFEVKQLLKTVVTHDFQNLTEYAYALLVGSLQENDLELQTPFYHIIPNTELGYVEVLVGY